MPLQEYHRKRNFTKTAEPKGRPSKTKTKALSFVVQEHHASHLHYDFRLEWNGVLKSWAIPKGPSRDPKIKRLAVEVEDHPLAYGSFEGIIPEHEYGAGEVFLWDTGTWIPLFDPELGFKKGHLQFELKGKKLKGRWDLIRTHFAGRQNQWLLVKGTDAFAKADDNVVPQKTRLHKETTNHPTPKKKSARPSTKALTTTRAKPQQSFIKPELAQLMTSPPEGPNWLHEIKFDGYRMQAHLFHGSAKLLTRTGQNWSDKFPTLIKALEKLSVDEAILDGEVVQLDKEGRSDFQLLQNVLKGNQTASLIYYAFDLLSYSEQDIRELSLLERKKRLKMILKKAPRNIRYSEEFQGSGKDLLSMARVHKLEGIISKNSESPYRSTRNSNWIKTKCTHQQEFIIGGYTEGSGARAQLGALLLGVYKNKKLTFVGKVGTGFTEKSLRDVFYKLSSLEQEMSPFQKKSPQQKNIHWVKPKLSAQISFANWTHDEHLRAPVFHGLREDKPTKDILIEMPTHLEEISTVTLSNPNKILYPKEKITKLDVANYYAKISTQILPFLKNRPLSLLRCPEGVLKTCFFQKHLPTQLSPTLREVDIIEKSVTKKYISVFDPQGLTTLVQMGAFEIHCWNSQAEKIENPDQIVIDFDPGPQVPWKQVIEAALRLKKILDSLGIKSFVKLSGGKGLHVHIPVKPIYSWDQIKAFSQALAKEMEDVEPNLYVSKMGKVLRTKKIFVDYFRNTRGATAVAPYSLRARPVSAVALPIEWHQLKNIKSGSEFTLNKTLLYLAKRKKDPWKDYFQSRQRIKILDQNIKRSPAAFSKDTFRHPHS